MMPTTRVETTKGSDMIDSNPLGGTFALADGVTLTRMGYGAMQLAGPQVFGPPADRDTAAAVLREVVESGINHIDTSDFYGPQVTNQIIKEALHPYPDSLHLVTKVGARRDEEGGWPHARKPEELRQAVYDNLRNLGLDTLDVVNLRVGGFSHPEERSLEEPFTALAELRQEGLIRHLGVSTVSAHQIVEAQAIAPVVCVQNFYNIAHRHDDSLIDSLAAQGIAYVAYFPLGGFTPLQFDTLGAVASRLATTPIAVALAWLLQRSPNILLIPGTSSVVHLRENMVALALTFSDDDLFELDTIGASDFGTAIGVACIAGDLDSPGRIVRVARALRATSAESASMTKPSDPRRSSGFRSRRARPDPDGPVR
jgi:aryl-alcohol dehydrogenase-like predicted oxidoreductase